MGKIRIELLLEDNTILKLELNNPSSKFVLSYKLNNEIIKKTYIFDRTKLFIRKKFLGKERVIFYKEGSPKPLDTSFSNTAVNMTEVQDIIDTGLFKALISSTKTGMNMDLMKTVFIIAGIVIIGFVVLKKMF